MPFEIKELTFKCAAGMMGCNIVGYIAQVGYYGGPLTFSALFALNWMYKATSIMTSTVRKVELHKDGKTVTMTTGLGKVFDVKISEV